MKVHYTGKLNDGQIFDSSLEREPLEVTLGQGMLIPGFEKGNFVGPTMFSNVTTDMDIYTQEIFGPALCVLEVETLDEKLEIAEVFGTVEAVKTVSDLFMPLSGTIIEFNESLEDEPEIVNEDPYGKGWMIKIQLDNEAQISELLDADAYNQIIGA